jgi:hypothetical protein
MKRKPKKTLKKLQKTLNKSAQINKRIVLQKPSPEYEYGKRNS